MAWPEISIEDFPPERDDEPSSLRQDIIDELSDHFACALNRELLKNPDEQLARRRVIELFGDPIKIARQLWLDAMKEKIMSQRIMTGISVLMAVCCIAVVGIAWSMMQQSESLNLKMLEQMAAMADRPQPATRELDQQFLNQLEVMIQKQVSQTDSSSGAMNPVLFQLVVEKKGGKPAVGFSGTLTKVSADGGDFKIEAVSDAQGQLDFGRLPWGKYQINLRAPWNEEWSEKTFSTLPGRKYEETIVCPAAVPGKVPVQFQVNWPTRPEEKNYYVLCDFRLEKSQAHFEILSDSVGKYFLQAVQTFQQAPSWQYSWWTYRYNVNQEPDKIKAVFLIDVLNNRVALCPLTPDGDFKNIDLQELAWESSVEFLQGNYYSPAIYLLRKEELTRVSELNSLGKVETIVRSDNRFSMNDYGGNNMGAIISPINPFELAPQVVKSLEQNKNPIEKKFSSKEISIRGYRENRKAAFSSFIATKDQPNIWKINIPDLFPITQESGSLSNAL